MCITTIPMNFISFCHPLIQLSASITFLFFYPYILPKRVWETSAVYSVPNSWAHVQTNKLYLVYKSIITKAVKYKIPFSSTFRLVIISLQLSKDPEVFIFQIQYVRAQRTTNLKYS